MERRRRRWWTVSITIVSALIVLAAMVSGAFQLAVRSVPGYRLQLEERLGTLLGRPVSIGDLRLTWRGYYPSLDLDRITLLATPSAPDAIAADRLRLAFSLPRLAGGDWMPTRVDLVGAEITATRDAEGKLHVRGFQPTASADHSAVLQRLRQIDYLRLVRCVLVYTDVPLELDQYRFEVTRGDLDQGDDHFEFDLELGLPATLGQALTVHADLDGDLAVTSTWSGPWAAYLRGLGDGPLIQRWFASDARVSVDRARLRLTGEVEGGRIPSLDAEWESGAIDGERAGLHYHLNALEAAAKITVDETGWAAQLQKLQVQGAAGTWPDTKASAKSVRTKDGFDLTASADFVRLRDVAPWLHLLRAPPPKLAALHDARGDVEALSVHWRHGDGDDRYTVAARLKNLNLSAVGRPVGFANLTGELSASEKGGRLIMKSIPLWFEVPRAFPGPGQFDALSATVSWRRDGQDWEVRAPDLRWKILDSEGQGSLGLLLPREGSPVMDLKARVSARDPMRLKPFIPYTWGPGLRDWLSNGLLAARVPAGEITIQGPLSDFPFAKTNNGTFALDLEVADVRLAFHPDWPTIERLGAQLKFRGNALAITSDGAAMLGARIGHVDARFDDLHAARLIIDGEVGGDLARLYRVVEASPLEKTLAALVHHTRAAGPASVTVHLDVPLHESSKTVASGVIRLKDARLEYKALKEPIRGIVGEIVFGADGVYSEKSLTAQFYELPVEAKLTAVTPHLSRLLAEFRYAPRADGTGVSTLVPSFIRSQLSGESAWRAELDIGSEANSSLRLSTDLQGVAIRFPAPLSKKAEEVASLNLGFSGDEKIPLRIGIDYKERFSADLQFAAARGGGVDLASAFLRMGEGPAVATEPGIVVEGHVAEMDLAAWSAALTSSDAGDEPLSLKRAELSIDRPIVGGQTLLPTRVHYAPQAGGWVARLEGEGAEGQLTWQSAAGGTLNAQLQHLAMNYHDAEDKAGKSAPRPPLDPAKFPVLNLDGAIVRIGGLDFGHLRLGTARVPGGQRLTQLKLAGGALELEGSGQWWRRDGASGANLSFHLGSERMADVLRALDYAPTVTAKASRFDGDLLWAPNPAGVEFAQARGHLAIELENGNVKTIEPGAGRVLGLLNFYALPRRLSFNFRDVVGQGLAYDKITGTFDLGDGNAHTSDLLIAGPSLRMETRGRIGLAARDYDQRITVYPDMSSGITLGALLLGGPALGALALIAQQVLDKPLDQVTQLSYHLGGTWDNPEIKKGDGSDDEPKKRRAEPGKP